MSIVFVVWFCESRCWLRRLVEDDKYYDVQWNNLVCSYICANVNYNIFFVYLMRPALSCSCRALDWISSGASALQKVVCSCSWDRAFCCARDFRFLRVASRVGSQLFQLELEPTPPAPRQGHLHLGLRCRP